jgi:hypothetical protein
MPLHEAADDRLQRHPLEWIARVMGWRGHEANIVFASNAGSCLEYLGEPF